MGAFIGGIVNALHNIKHVESQISTCPVFPFRLHCDCHVRKTNPTAIIAIAMTQRNFFPTAMQIEV